MKKALSGLAFVFLVLAGFSLCYGAIADDLAAKKDLNIVFQNALLAGMDWETAVFETIKAGADARQVIETALAMNGDPQGIIRGAKRAGVDEKTIRDALAAAYSGGVFAGTSKNPPIGPVPPSWSSAGGGGGGGGGRPDPGKPASPFK